MKNLVSLVMFMSLTTMLWSADEVQLRKRLPEYQVVSDEAVDSVPSGKVVVCGYVRPHGNQNGLCKAVVTIGDSSYFTDSKGWFKVMVDSGSEVLRVTANGYGTVVTAPTELKGGHVIELLFRLDGESMPVIVDKPVIYLYPDEKQKVQLQVEPHSDLVFTYPDYRNGWEVTAHPDGSLVIGVQTYRYLFWESIADDPEQLVDGESGFVVSGADLVPFLEEKLSILGLNSSEMQDFITYWVPRMQSYPDLWVQFLTGPQYRERIAGLDVDPEPDTRLRIFMSWRPVEPGFNCEEQVLEKGERKGFVLVEWGGTQLSAKKTGEAD